MFYTIRNLHTNSHANFSLKSSAGFQEILISTVASPLHVDSWLSSHGAIILHLFLALALLVYILLEVLYLHGQHICFDVELYNIV